jgi:hypothetical protein
VTPQEPNQGRPGRSPWLLWVLGGAVAGAIVGLAVTGEAHGFWPGALVGGATEGLLVLAVNLLFGGRQGNLWFGALAVLCGSAVGLLAGAVLTPSLLPSVLIGTVVGVADAIFAWVIFPDGAAPGRGLPEEAEPDEDVGGPEDDFSDEL